MVGRFITSTSTFTLDSVEGIEPILCIWTVSVRLLNFAIETKHREGGTHST